jgi:hypothetical protein
MLKTTCNVGCACGANLEEYILDNTGALQNFLLRGDRGPEPEAKHNLCLT